MIPTAYEFDWDLGHIVFLGIFYAVVAAVAVALGVAAHRWLGDLRHCRAPAIAWEETFRELPDDRRHCRHEFDGTARHRICDHGFDCSTCAQHRSFVEAGHARGGEAPAPTGVHLPENCYYHRGHTWVARRPDGLLDVGLDDLASRCVGQGCRVVPPAAGSELHAGDAIATVVRGPFRTRVLAPVAGEVIAAGDLAGGRLCIVRPAGPELRLGHLLHGREADVWMLREMESLQQLLSPDAAATTLADGGVPVADLAGAYPDADWDEIWGHLCLES